MLLTTDSASQAYEAANVVHKQVRFTSLNQRTRTNAKLLVNSCTFGRGDDRNPSAHRSSTSRQQQAPIIGNSSYSELHWTDEPRQERYAGRDFKLGGQELIVSTSYSYVPPGLVPTASSWPSTAFLDPRLTVYGGDGWPGNQYIDEAHPGPLFSAPGGNADGPGINLLMGVGVAAPALEQAFPVVQRALPASQPCPPPALNWPCQPPSSWDLPVHTVIQHGGDSASIGPLGMRPEISYSQLAAASVLTAPSGGRAMPHGPFLSVATSHSVRPSPHSDPVSVARTFLVTVISAPFRPFFFFVSGRALTRYAGSTRRPCGDLSSNATTFQCLWTSGGTRCRALIKGDRKSVSSHLRDGHAFTCDGHTVACAWGQCRMSMQRRNIPRHIVTCHLEVKVTCSQCGLALSRSDANKKHRLACPAIRMPAVVEANEEEDGRLFF